MREELHQVLTLLQQQNIPLPEQPPQPPQVSTFRFLRLGMLWLLVCAVQYWLFTAGKPFSTPLQHWDGSTTYTQLVNSFQQGHCYLPESPAPGLLALPDPYDDIANAKHRSYDLSYYRGRYFLYFGPVPALLMLLERSIGLRTDSDSPHVLMAAFAANLAFALAVRAVVRRLYPDQSLRFATVAGLTSGLLVPMTACLARPGFYELPVVVAQVFLWAGTYALWARPTPPGPIQWLLAGTAHILAVGSRLALAPALAVWGFAAGSFHGRRSLVLVAPWLVGLAGLAYYNWVRFDDPFNPGFVYQLTTIRNDSPSITSIRYLLPNLYVYLFAPPALGLAFPYVTAQASALPNWLPNPKYFDFSQPVVGALWAIPLVLFLPLGIAGMLKHRYRDVNNSLAALLLTGLPILMIYNPCLRYQMDFSNSLLAISIVGVYEARQRWPRLAHRLAGFCWASGIVVGTLVGMTGQYDHFAQNNPALWAKLQALLSFTSPP